jgi:hypothetical protein
MVEMVVELVATTIIMAIRTRCLSAAMVHQVPAIYNLALITTTKEHRHSTPTTTIRVSNSLSPAVAPLLVA